MDTHGFEEHLLRKRFSPRTVACHRLRPKRLRDWLRKRRTTLAKCTYTDMLAYIKHLRDQRHYGHGSINNEIRGLSLYFGYLIEQGLRSDNPADQLHVRGSHIKVLKDLLEPGELDGLYHQMPQRKGNVYMGAIAQRDRAVAGLMVYQAACPKELYLLEEGHLQLRKGKIYIPGTVKSNGRLLELRPWQVVDLVEYTGHARPMLGKWFAPDIEGQFLYGSFKAVQGIVARIMKQLRGHNGHLRSFNQVRASVIVQWLKANNLRKVQYMAGHRYISSTEKYVQDDLENLHEIVDNFHPIS